MQHLSAILLDQQQFNDWAVLTLGSASLAGAQPGQFVAARCTVAGSYDPLLRQPLFLAATDQPAGTCQLLVARTHPAFAFLSGQPRGVALDLLGPLGHGWRVDSGVRTVALLGTADRSAALFALAQRAVARGLSVSVLLGADDQLNAPAPFLLPAAAEYHVATGADAAATAVSLLDDDTLRWADLLAVAIPYEHLDAIVQRVRSVRLQWSHNFVQAALLAPDDQQLACCVGVCGVCAVATRQTPRLVCTDGPIFDLRDLVR